MKEFLFFFQNWVAQFIKLPDNKIISFFFSACLNRVGRLRHWWSFVSSFPFQGENFHSREANGTMKLTFPDKREPSVLFRLEQALFCVDQELFTQRREQASLRRRS